MDSPARAEQDPVPESIRMAERWRVAGKTLRENAPELFDQLLVLMVISAVPDPSDDPAFITESYFPT